MLGLKFINCRCKWHGEPCSNTSISPRVTDLGLCYTFVGDSNDVHYANNQGTLQWRLHECDGLSNHRRLLCLFNCWFRRRSEKTSKLRVTGLCVGNSPVTGKFRAQKANNVLLFDDVIMKLHQMYHIIELSRYLIFVKYSNDIRPNGQDHLDQWDLVTHIHVSWRIIVWRNRL